MPPVLVASKSTRAGLCFQASNFLKIIKRSTGDASLARGTAIYAAARAEHAAVRLLMGAAHDAEILQRKPGESPLRILPANVEHHILSSPFLRRVINARPRARPYGGTMAQTIAKKKKSKPAEEEAAA
jgi:hypothetical protein